MPKLIGVATEASFEILETARVAPTRASNPPAITTPDGYTDARRESRYLAFGQRHVRRSVLAQLTEELSTGAISGASLLPDPAFGPLLNLRRCVYTTEQWSVSSSPGD